MNNKDKELMEKYDITSITKTMFFYKDFKYENLDRAVSYAQHVAKKLARKEQGVTRSQS